MPASLTTGEILRHPRERKGMSRAVLAGLAGYSPDWLKRIESGQRGMSLPGLLRLARLLHVIYLIYLSILIDGDVPMPIGAWDGPRHPSATALREIVGPMSFSPGWRAQRERLLTLRRDDEPAPDLRAPVLRDHWTCWSDNTVSRGLRGSVDRRRGPGPDPDREPG